MARDQWNWKERKLLPFIGAALAQLVEHRIRNAGARGSNPLSGTITLTLVKPCLLLSVPKRGCPRGYGVGGALAEQV